MATELELNEEKAKKATLLILAAIQTDVEKAMATFGVLLQTLYKTNPDKIPTLTKDTDNMISVIVDGMIANKVNRASTTLACLATVKQMVQMIGEDIFGKITPESEAKQ